MWFSFLLCAGRSINQFLLTDVSHAHQTNLLLAAYFALSGRRHPCHSSGFPTLLGRSTIREKATRRASKQQENSFFGQFLHNAATEK